MPDTTPPSDRRLSRALRGWRPPSPIEVVVRYWPGRNRGPDVMWTTPFLVDADGQVVQYLAAGPAGQPAAAYLVAHIDVRKLPPGATVRMVTDVDESGVVVYGVPRHTLN